MESEAVFFSWLGRFLCLGHAITTKPTSLNTKPGNPGPASPQPAQRKTRSAQSLAVPAHLANVEEKQKESSYLQKVWNGDIDGV